MDTERLLLDEALPAPDFELTDTHGQPVRLSAYAGRKNVVLVFNRGFS